MIDEVVGLAENLEPIALIGAGGIGKTSIALTVLHHHRIIERFGDDRRFVRCDQFPASRLHFLARLSKVIGAKVDNPDSLTSLEPYLSSRKMLIVLDNAESILDPQGANAHEIYAIVDHLCQFRNLSVCITSRITTVPRYCKCPEISTLSMEAACNIFYGIYGDRRGRSMAINDLLQRLDFHALSITLLATAGSHNAWDSNRLVKEWDAHRAQVLRTDFNESLAATIELSLASPTFCKLGPDARDLLGVVAFFPHGVDEQNLDWLFPNIPDRRNIFDKFCVLSLTYRSNGFITALAPIRDYLSPRDPKSSPLLCKTRDRYFTRMSVVIHPAAPGYGQARWIVSEDVNVEHLLNVFTSIDADSGDVWDACYHFLEHLHWHKPRRTVLGPKIEALPDDHRSKPKCLSRLSSMFRFVGKYEEERRLLTAALKLGRERGDVIFVADILRYLSEASRMLKLYEEGILQAEEASEIFKRLGNTEGEICCLGDLAWLLLDNAQLDAAEDAASRAIYLGSETFQELYVCQSHQVLGEVYRRKGDKNKATHHLEAALRIASSLNWQDQLYSIHSSLAELFSSHGQFGDATTHVEWAKSYVVNDPYCLGCATEMQAMIWYRECRFEDAKSEVLKALEIFERLEGAEGEMSCRDLLRKIEAGERESTGELSKMMLCVPLAKLPIQYLAHHPAPRRTLLEGLTSALGGWLIIYDPFFSQWVEHFSTVFSPASCTLTFSVWFLVSRSHWYVLYHGVDHPHILSMQCFAMSIVALFGLQQLDSQNRA